MNKRRLIVIVSAVIILCAAGICFYLLNSRFQLKIGGQEINKDLYVQVMNSQVSDVTSYFAGKGEDRVDREFWSRETDGEIPYKVLADKTLERLKYMAAVYDIAAENGYAEENILADLPERMEEENRDRKETAENGGTVYGLLEFSLDTYLEYDMDRIEKAYCEDLENPGMDISDEERQAYYDENRDALFRKNDDISLTYIKIPYGDGSITEEQKKKYEDELKELYKNTDENSSLEVLAKQNADLKDYMEQVDISSSEASAYTRMMGDVLEYASELEKNECTQVIDEGGCLYLVQCTDRTHYGYMELEEVKDNINKTLREENYEKEVQKRAESIETEYSESRIYSFTKKSIE